MSLALLNPDCHLCWDNNQLRGGKVAASCSLFYLYCFGDEAGGIAYGLIAPKHHHASMLTMPDNWGKEFGEMFSVMRLLLRCEGKEFSPYWNDGKTAGQTVMGHWHVRIEPRLDGQPASGMGFGLLLAKYNSLVERINALATSDDPAAAAIARQLLA